MPGTPPIACAKRGCDAAAFDVTDSQAVHAAIDRIEADIGAIDVLINNAGIQRRHPFTEFPEQDWDDIIAVNQKAVFIVSQTVARYMCRARQDSQYRFDAKRAGPRHHHPLCGVQGAVKMRRAACAWSWRATTFRLTALPRLLQNRDDAGAGRRSGLHRLADQRTPAARWGDPQELIGAAVSWADASAFVNGQLLFVDGGMSAAV